MRVIAEPLPGAKLIEPSVFTDVRGSFVKTFHAPQFAEFGLAFAPMEEFFSTSAKGVLRGMHFQIPPQDHSKLVYCIAGRILDVLLDLRKSSPSFGQAVSAELSATNRQMFFIPSGIAHGFLALEDNAVTVYKTSTVHAPSHDRGIRWISFGFNWGVATPITSARDEEFPPLAMFESPFS